MRQIDDAILGVGLSIVGLVGIPLGVVLVRMWAKGERHGERISRIEAQVDRTDQVVTEIRRQIDSGFGRIEEQIKTLFRGQDNHDDR